MERSLSVLLPVRDVQSTLSDTVAELLDVLPELTRHFELLIIDDGSKDATIEVADELAANYPQVRVVRHGNAKGRAASIEDGLRQCQGDIIFLRDDGCRLPVDEIGRLWRAMDQYDLVLGCPQPIPEPKWNRWKQRSSSGQPGCQMARRRVIEPVKESLGDQTTLRARLERMGYQWHEVEMRSRSAQRGPVRPSQAASAGQTARKVCEKTSADEVYSRPKAPNYWTKLREPV